MRVVVPPIPRTGTLFQFGYHIIKLEDSRPVTTYLR